MKRLALGTLLLVLAFSTVTLPSARSDEGQLNVWRSDLWNVEYKISYLNVKPGQVITLDITFTANVAIYDFRLEVLCDPISLVSDNTWTFEHIAAGLPQLHTFQVKIPDSAATGTKYKLDLLIQGYSDPPLFTLLGWHFRGLWIWTEKPQYTGDTGKLQEKSIVITVT